MASFIHSADLHLGATFKNYPENYRKKLSDYQLLCLQYLVDTAIEKKVDAIIFAGDFFDHPNPSRILLEAVRRILAMLGDKGILFVLALGNHDAGVPADILASPIVKILPSEESETVEFQHWTLAGISFKNQWDMRNPMDFLPQRIQGSYVGLFHSGKDEEIYMPFSTADIERLNYDYLALGHVHRFTKIPSVKNAYYSGNLCALDGPGGFVYCDLRGGEPHWMASPPFPVKEISVELFSPLGNFRDIEKHKGELVKILLKGELDRGELNYLEHWIKEHRDMLIVNQTVLKNEFTQTALYTTSKRILKNSPEIFIDHLDLLDLKGKKALEYIQSREDQLLAKLEECFRDAHD